MFLLLFLLASPAFGRPSSGQPDVGAEIDKLVDIVKFTNETGKLLNDTKLFAKVSQSLEEAEQNILEMEAELKSLQSKVEQLKNEGDFFPEFNKAKRQLRETRQELRELAHRTVTEVDNVNGLLEDLNNGKIPVLLKLTIDRMKILMIETGERLTEARKKYQSALVAFDNLISYVKVETKILEELVGDMNATFLGDKAYAEKWKAKCKIISWFTFGLCSLITYYENEKPLGEALEELTDMTTRTDKLLERQETLNADIDNAIAIMTNEIELINEWANSAELVSKNIDDYPEEYLREYETIRTVFKTGLDDLKSVAQRFLDQPTSYLI